jgi:peptidoglycan/xylan/chitin deacetylase (PgdA/CDA1 family)
MGALIASRPVRATGVGRRPWRAVGLAGLCLALTGLVAATPATAREKLVALTFDDGPSPYTRDVLRQLDRKHVPGTFFVVGEHLDSYGSALRPMVRRGHEVANHSWSHPDLTNLSSKGIESQLERTNRGIRRIGGQEPRTFRPPYGALNRRVRRTARREGLRTVLWDVDPSDYYQPSPSTIVSRVVRGVGRRSIVLLHDGGGPRRNTVRAVPRIVSKLRRRGYRFVTVTEFFRSGPRPTSTAAAAGGGGAFEPEPLDAYRP